MHRLALTNRIWSALLMGVALGACASDGPLEPGGYRLEVGAYPAWTPEMHLTVEADGAFIGHRTEGDFGWADRCRGTLTREEHRDLTDVLNDANVLWRDDCPACAVDVTAFLLRIEVVEDGAAISSNGFRLYEGCDGWSRAIDRVRETADDVLAEQVSLGLCR